MKKNFRSLIASILAVAMIFTLAACGQSGKPDPQGGETPAFVYVPSFMEVKNEDNQAIGAACFTDRGFYTTPSEVVGQREPEEGEVKEYEGQFDIYAEKLYFVSYDGEITKLENYESFPFAPAEGHQGFGELSRLAADAAGNLAAICHSWESWNEAPAGMSEDNPSYYDYYRWEETWYLRTMDPTGRELSLQTIEVEDGSWFYPNEILYTDGKVFVAGSDGLHILDANGGGATKIGLDGYVQSVLKMRDGTPCMIYTDNATNESKLCAIDPASGRVTQTWKFPRNGYNFKSGGGDYDLYYQDGINIYGYSRQTESSEKLFDWLNVDISQYNLSFTALSDGRIFAVTNTWDSKWENVTTEFATLEKKALADAPQKETLTLACYGTDYQTENAIIRFNRSNDSVRINVVDYTQYNDYESEDGWDAGMNKLTTEIMAGTMPDILALNNLPYQQLAARGLLEDLYPYMDADREISREDFLPNALRALEVGGKLYSSVSSFSVVTLAGASSVVGSKQGWSFDELQAALAKMPEGCTVLNQFTTSGDILRTELVLDQDYYIDWDSGKVNFDSKEFIDLLNFSKLFPDSFDWESYWNSYDWQNTETESERIASGSQLLMLMNLSSFEDIAQQEAEFGGDMTYIGFPTASGMGSYLTFNSGYGISSSCQNKEAAWQFVRGFMTPKAFENMYWGFPANRDLLEKKLQEAMTIRYEKDEKGNYRLDENGEKIPIAITYIWRGRGEENEPVYALTRPQADKVMALVNSTDKLYVENKAAMSILFEQLDAFLSGQKTAEEVAKLVQGKMSIYVNEQR